MNAGVYDIGADDSQYNNAIIYGPVDATQDVSLGTELIVSSQQGDSDELQGSISIADGTKVNGLIVNIISRNNAAHPGLFEKNVTCDADGHFSANVGKDFLMDLNLYTPNHILLEFIDVHKLNGLLQVQLALGTKLAKNVYRHDGSSATVREINISSNSVDAKPSPSISTRSTSGNTPFKTWQVYTDNKTELKDGVLAINGGNLVMSDDLKQYSTNEWWQPSPYTFGGETFYIFGYLAISNAQEAMVMTVPSDVLYGKLNVSADNDGSWWYDYKVTACTRSPNNNIFSSVTYTFGDGTCSYDSSGCYSLSVYLLGFCNDVSYNSDNPNIVSIISDTTFNNN